MRSMTGFGRGTAELAGARATVDVRAVNHRFLDLKLRGASLPPSVEEQVASRVRSTLERGAVTVSVHVARAAGATRIDPDAARAAHASLSELSRALGVAGPDLALVLAQPGVVVAGEEEREDAPVLTALDAALAQLSAMRDTEGNALARELAARLEDLARICSSIAVHAENLPEQLRGRLHDRLRKLIRDEATDKANDMAGWLDPGRLAQEVALLAERADITEELVRLSSHLDQARALIGGGDGAVGRRLDFLVQELGRELNTIGSKSASTEISALVVEAKAVLEKVREQVQNVE